MPRSSPASFTLPSPMSAWSFYGENWDRVEDLGGRKADPNWKAVDKAGHGHFTQDGSWPTLEWKSEPCGMGHGDDCTSEGAWECRICGEEITPAIVAEGLVRIPGPTRYKAQTAAPNSRTTYQFDSEVMKRLSAALEETARTVLKDYITDVERWT